MGNYSYMAQNESYIPKVNDPVFREGHGSVKYVVISVDKVRNTARIKNTGEGPTVLSEVRWADIFPLDESQNALRIVKEATED
jgi:hypothetical protein